MTHNFTSSLKGLQAQTPSVQWPPPHGVTSSQLCLRVPVEPPSPCRDLPSHAECPPSSLLDMQMLKPRHVGHFQKGESYFR